MARKTALDQLNDTVAEILRQYADEATESLRDVAVQIGDAGVKALKQKSAETFGGKNYKKSWKKKIEDTRTGTTVTIYNERGWEPHLLENGHMLRNGKRWPGRKHIEPVEQLLIEDYAKAVEEKLT